MKKILLLVVTVLGMVTINAQGLFSEQEVSVDGYTVLQKDMVTQKAMYKKQDMRGQALRAYDSGQKLPRFASIVHTQFNAIASFHEDDCREGATCDVTYFIPKGTRVLKVSYANGRYDIVYIPCGNRFVKFSPYKRKLNLDLEMGVKKRTTVLTDTLRNTVILTDTVVKTVTKKSEVKPETREDNSSEECTECTYVKKNYPALWEYFLSRGGQKGDIKEKDIKKFIPSWKFDKRAARKAARKCMLTWWQKTGKYIAFFAGTAGGGYGLSQIGGSNSSGSSSSGEPGYSGGN